MSKTNKTNANAPKAGAKAPKADAPKAGASIDPKVQAIYMSTLGILSSKLTIDRHVNRQVELSIIGNGTTLSRGAILYNTNVTTEDRLAKALDMLSPDEFFAKATSEEEALKLRNEALNTASIAFSIPIERGERLSNGELVVCLVQEYDSKATGRTELGLKFIRKERAIALESARSNAKFAEYRAMVDPFDDEDED